MNVEYVHARAYSRSNASQFRGESGGDGDERGWERGCTRISLLSRVYPYARPLIYYIRIYPRGDIYRSNVLHMLLLHHIITRLALLNLVTRQSRKLLQRYNSISGKSKSIRPGGRGYMCYRNENVRGIRRYPPVSVGVITYYALLINSLSRAV